MDLSAYLLDINTSHDILFSLHKQVQDLSFISLFSDTSNCEAKAERPYSLLSFSSEVDTDIEDTSPQVEKYKYKFALLRGEAQLCLPYHTGDSEAYYVVFDVNFVICLRYLSVIFVPLLSVYPSVHINA